jgi:hypothetical protein
MAELSLLERNILKAKGVTDAQLESLPALGITAKTDFAVVGDAATLAQVSGMSLEVASVVMQWAIGAAPVAATPSAVLVESADIVHCAHCKARQPKDYKPGDLCPQCGRQAEPVLACYWCGASGPGKFCRQCGAEHVLSADLELALQLRRDGLAKDDIPKKLAGLSVAEKEALFARARKGR